MLWVYKIRSTFIIEAHRIQIVAGRGFYRIQVARKRIHFMILVFNQRNGDAVCALFGEDY